MRLPRLDVIFGLPARAIDIFVEGAGGATRQVGDDEACVHTVRSSLDTGDDPLGTILACGAVVEFLEPAELFAASGRAPRGRALFQPGNMLT